MGIAGEAREVHAVWDRRSSLVVRKTEGARSEEDHPRGRRRGRNNGSRLVRVGWRGALPGRADGALTVTLPAYGFVHTYAIESLDPCGAGSFSGVSTDANVFGIQETITGTLLNGHLTFTATYASGYSWSYDGPLAGATAHASDGQSFGVTSTFVRAKTWQLWRVRRGARRRLRRGPLVHRDACSLGGCRPSSCSTGRPQCRPRRLSR